MVSILWCPQFIFWQKGGGFDRNLWNAKATHNSIKYIEANPVLSRLAASPEEWPCSYAHARSRMEGVIPDTGAIAVAVPNRRFAVSESRGCMRWIAVK
jgi:hypothetical protein